MRAFLHAVLILALSQLATLSAAHAQDTAQTIFIISYIEVLPTAKNPTAAMLKALAAASRKEAGALRFEALQRIAPTSQFALLEVWKDQQALDAHTGAAYVKQFRDQIAPFLIAPIDDRLCVATAVGPITPGRERGARYAITHVDIGPPNPAHRDAAVPLLQGFAEASRKDAGNLRFDVLMQKARTNHFQMVEVWKDQATADAHALAGHTRDFRGQIALLIGALYDQRWYKAL